MKKLMIAAAIVCAAALSQAGTVSWNSGEIYLPGADGSFSTTLAGKDAVAGTLFILSATQWETYYNEGDYAKASAAIWKDYKDGTLADATATGKSSADGLLNLTDGVTYANNAPVYAALIYETTADGKDWYIANLGDYKAKTSAKGVADFAGYEFGAGLSANDNPISGWTAASAVPEPTSGLLLLLGVAGLALRRRRA